MSISYPTDMTSYYFRTNLFLQSLTWCISWAFSENSLHLVLKSLESAEIVLAACPQAGTAYIGFDLISDL
jgi:hypothetical protein